MNRIITFGCSLTYGHGLSDCFIPPHDPGHQPSKLGWPYLIAESLNKKCINLSNPGSSNKRIWNSIVNFDYEESDIVFILWTSEVRTSIIHKNHISDIGPWNNEFYYKDMFDENDALLMSKLYVNHANIFLKSKSVIVYNLVSKKKLLPILDFFGEKINHVPIYLGELMYRYPFALDNNHPGEECQIAFTKKLLNYLKIKNNLPEVKELTKLYRLKRYFLGSYN